MKGVIVKHFHLQVWPTWSLFLYSVFFFLLVVLVFQLRASHLLSRCSNTKAETGVFAQQT
jgi:uncharacterized membrane protein AbrB (regulator of aidB expression)